MDAVRAHFRPEFLNRLDERSSSTGSAGDMDGIVRIQLARLEAASGGAQDHAGAGRGAMSWLADEGYDPVFGARPLKRVIQRALQDPLAEMLLAGEVMDGDTVPRRGRPKTA
jgi:ATP-dependent Clp protease ATP-binding subunit ClpB